MSQAIEKSTKITAHGLLRVQDFCFRTDTHSAKFFPGRINILTK